MPVLKLATFNVNNIVKRLGPLLRWLDRESPDIVCLQELKATDATFPIGSIRAAGYGARWVGQRSWNGVAILAKDMTPIETRRALPGDPADDQSRYLRGGGSRNHRRVPVPAERQSTARPEVHLQAGLVRTTGRPRPEPSRQRSPRRARR
jgi:hypothetical protein